jgi:glutathione S-transferase
MVAKRLDEFARRLDGRDYLEDGFTAGDLLMTSVLRILRHTDFVARRPALEAYRLRCEARPAFQAALAAQLAPFAENAPPGRP